MENGEVLLQDLYSFQEIESRDGKVSGKLVKTGTLRHKEKLQMAGL